MTNQMYFNFINKSIIFILIAFIATQPLLAKQKRVALVLGNAAYTKIGKLKNPVNDANGMTSVLIKMGFKVIKGTNLNRKKMRTKIREFGKAIRTADVAMFYFAGHGLQYDGDNYLVPLKTNIETEDEIVDEAINASAILRKMEVAGAKVNVVVLDACRNNPFARSFRSSNRGLARIEGPTGSLIAYATAPGSVASDGDGKNGLYTEKLMQYIQEPIPAEQVFKKVRNAVMDATSKKQVPWENSSLTGGDFYFNTNITINQPKIQVASADPDMASKQENTFWNAVFGSGNEALYQAYLADYPNGNYKRIALIKIKELKAKNRPKPKVKATQAKLTLRSNVNGDTVSINGEEKGSTKLSLNLNTGIYEIEVSKSGYGTWERSLQIHAGVDQVVYAKLKRIPVKPVIKKAQAYIASVQKVSRPSTNSTRSITDNATGMTLLKIPSGCFQMGSNESVDEKPIHEVCITKDYYLGKYEVTKGQWKAIMGNNPSYFTKGDNHPVEQVSWDDIQGFIRKLNNKTGQSYRLPTEAEWEYAAKAGSTTKYPWGNSIDCSKASYNGGKNSACYSKPNGQYRGHQQVGSYQPNAWGLYDTVGNVWEWVQDKYDRNYYKNSPRNNPTGASGGSGRGVRGGSWLNSASGVRSAYRYGDEPSLLDSDLGFRLARTR